VEAMARLLGATGPAGAGWRSGSSCAAIMLSLRAGPTAAMEDRICPTRAKGVSGGYQYPRRSVTTAIRTSATTR
jgi:hypothetical protein